MRIADLLRRLGRKMEPPGNRSSLDSSYRQPNTAGPNSRSDAAGNMTERR